jgi:N-acetylmuramoyl-L-alanine amidase
MLNKSISLTLCFCLAMLISIAQKNALKTIIIDPGHGGVDPGTTGLISKEKDVALQISLKLGKAIQESFPSIRLVFTRTTDALAGGSTNITQSLRYRADLANQSKGDLFISIHCDAAGKKAGGWYEKKVVDYKTKVVYVGKGKNRKKKTIKEPIYESYYVENKVTGPSTYIWAADRSDEKLDHINDNEDGEEMVEDSANLLDLTSPEARLRAQLYEKYFFQNSYTMARFVQDEFKAVGRNDKGVLQRNNKGIWVLQATGMPSILIETGYLSNKTEEEYLNSEEGQNEIVNNIITALRKYKAFVENPKGSTNGNAAPKKSF